MSKTVIDNTQSPITYWKLFRAVLRQYLYFKKFIRLSEEHKRQSPIPQNFVEEILVLGSTFIKLGQVLSTRPDVLPPQYIQALESLQDSVPPFDFSIVCQTVESELGKPIDQLFGNFDEIPAASASLSQVHLASLPDGSKIAVKFQRPGIKARMSVELTILGRLVSIFRFINKKMFINLNLKDFFNEFRRYTLKELDFSNEGKVYDRFNVNFKNGEKVFFPKIYWDFTTSKVLTMQKVGGL